MHASRRDQSCIHWASKIERLYEMSIEFQLARARSLHITFELWADNKCAINGSVSFCREANASLPYRGLVQYTLEPMHSNRLIECEALASGGSGGDGIVGVAVAAARDLIVWYITNGIKSECWMLRMWVQCGKCEKNMALRFVTCDTKSSISPLSVLEYRNCIRARKKTTHHQRMPSREHTLVNKKIENSLHCWKYRLQSVGFRFYP